MGTAPAGHVDVDVVRRRTSSSLELGRELGACAADQESAAWADSRITSPSWPVIVSLPLPGIAVASMNRTSPPTGVQARPVATPGTSRPAPRLGEEPAPAEQLAGALGGDRAALPSSLALGDLAGDLAADGADLALEVADARPRGCTPR